MCVTNILTGMANGRQNASKIIIYLTDADVHRAGDGSTAEQVTRDNPGSTPITTPAGNF